MSVEAKLATLAATATNVARDQEKRRILVDELRDAGATWADIGNALGVTRQAAWHKYGREAPERSLR